VIVLFTTAIASIDVQSIISVQNMTEDDKKSSRVSPEIAMPPAEDNMNGSVTNQTITEWISPNTTTTIDSQSMRPAS